jgi:hypothetical protein
LKIDERFRASLLLFLLLSSFHFTLSEMDNKKRRNLNFLSLSTLFIETFEEILGTVHEPVGVLG